MEITIEAKHLNLALSRIIGVVQHKSSRPILTCVLINASQDGVLVLESTNIDISVSVTVPVTVNTAGRVAVPARKFADYLGTLAGGTVTLSADEDGRVSVVSSRGRSELAGYPGADFPSTQSFEDLQFTSVSGADLKGMLSQTIKCASTDDSRFSLVGVYVHQVSDVLRFVATDGHRLAVAQPTNEFAWSVGAEGMILPSRGVEEVRKLIDGSDEVAIASAANHVVVRSPDQQVTMRLTDGKFPDYDQVIPKANDRRAVVARAEVLHALRSVSVFANGKTNQVELMFSTGRLTLSAHSESGTAQEELPCSYEGDDLRIGFNCRYLRDALESVDEEGVAFHMGDHLAPAMIMAESGDHYLCVIMPMRL
jgi:DNA polymerase-3 subunit beta